MRKKRAAGFRAVPVFLFFLAFVLLCGYSGLDEKIFDEAGLLTDQEEEKLQAELVKAADRVSLDVVIVTIDDAEGKDVKSYADDYYDAHHFGYEKENGSGILILLDMDNREICISTAGRDQERYTDAERDDILDYELMPYMKQGDYYGACLAFLDSVIEYGTNDEVARNGYYDPVTDTFVEYSQKELREMAKKAAMQQKFSARSILLRLGASLLIGAAGAGMMVLQVRSQKAPGGRVYVKPGSERLRDRLDRKVNTTVVTRKIPKPSESSGNSGGGGRSHTTSHTSSSGHSHSTSSRKF